MKEYTQLCIIDATETEYLKKVLDYMVTNSIDHECRFYAEHRTVGVYAWITQQEYRQFLRSMDVY